MVNLTQLIEEGEKQIKKIDGKWMEIKCKIKKIEQQTTGFSLEEIPNSIVVETTDEELTSRGTSTAGEISDSTIAANYDVCNDQPSDQKEGI